jgi:ERF superfamily
METTPQQVTSDYSRFDHIFETESPYKPEFIKEFNEAQALFKRAVKDKVNSHFGNSYSDLAGVMDSCIPDLLGRGFIINQTVAYHPGHRQSFLTTKIENVNGWRQSCVPLAALAKGPQAFGSELTYMRRYCLGALMGVAADDDDGNAATDAHNRDQPQRGQGKRSERRDHGERGQDRPRQTPRQESGAPPPRQLNEHETAMLALAKDLRAYLTGEPITTKAKLGLYLKAQTTIADLERLKAGSEILYGKLMKQVEEFKAKLPAE